MSSPLLFDSQFEVRELDPGGKKFDRVSRVVMYSPVHEMDMQLDVAVDIYPIDPSARYTFALASSLRPEEADADGNGPSAREAWRLDGPAGGGLADDYEYVMYGKIYKYDDGADDKVTVYGSFGGLLMALTGSYRHLTNVAVGSNVYLLMRA